MRRTVQFWVGILALIALFGLIGWYAYYRSENLLNGPIIMITSPQNNTTVGSSNISITGNVHNATSVTLDDRKIFLDEEGNFNEKLLLAPGYTIITLKAEDQFNRSVEKQVEVLFASSTSNAAASSSLFL